MSRNTRITAFVLVAALLFNGLSFPVYADQSVSGGEVLLEDLSVENFEENTVEITEETEEATEEATESLKETTEEPEDESLTLLLEYVGETVMPYAVENSATDESQRFTLEQVGLEKDGNTITIRSGADLVKLSHVTPEEYSTLTLRFTNTQSEFDTTIKQTIVIDNTTYEWDFVGLTSFQGTISVTNGTEDYPIKLVRPLFNELSDGATIVTDTDTGLLLMFAAKTDDGKENAIPSALLADTITHTDNSTEKQWKIRVTASDQSGIMPPLIGIMAEDAQVCLSVGTNSGSYKVTQVKGNANAGLLCARMNARSGLTLTGLTTGSEGMPAVTAGSGDAGSLVGTMAAGAVLALNNAVSSITLPNVTASSGNAGGLVGSATNATFPQISLTGSNTKIEGKNAGGVIGSYIYSNTDPQEVSMSISGITMSATGDGTNGNAGGIFGILQNTGTGTFKFGTSVTVDVTLSAKNNAGGLVGQYSAKSLDAALLLNQDDVTSSLSSTAASAYGGLIGWVEGSGTAYIEVESAGEVKVSGTANNYGGLIGSLSDGGHMLKVGEVTISKNGTIRGKTNAGGLVGLFQSGVLWLSNAVAADTPECDKRYFRGNYVGQRNNTLVFTTDEPTGGWDFNADGCNDIGNWGQVLQVYSGSELEGLLSFGNHTVAVTGSGTAVSDKLSFAQAALRFQLDSKGALVIGNDFDLNNVTLSLTGNIDLNGTGFTGFQRDDSKADQARVTLNCENADITFPDIIIYGGAENNNNDNVSHTRQGLFSKTSSLEVNNAEGSHLALKGSISVTTFNRYVYLGSLVAESSGNVTATNVISGTDLIITGTNNSEERISGLVAQQNGGEVSFNGCTWFSGIEYNGSNTCYLGGLLARAEQGNIVTINNCTIEGEITKTGTGECYVGGLIASLRDQANGSWSNILNINGLTAEGVMINTVGSTKTGGILGWEWMTDTTDIKGVTVKDCNLNGGSGRFGGLVYKGSGYWNVHDTGIRFISGNSFTGGSSGSEVSGLLLASGCKLDGHNNALYLEIQNGAYTIDSNSVTLSIDGSTTFDEIVGVTESVDGNGIVSIGTGINIDNPTIADCDYIKQLTADYQNPNTRYYYNLDVFGAVKNVPDGDIDSSGKMVLYSAYTHCYSGLKNYFYNSPGKITGSSLNLTGYSYYPAEVYRDIENAAITFDYQGLEGNTRMPSDQNRQNCGMHTGLFTDVEIIETANTPQTLTVENLTLAGTIGISNEKCGALIQGNAQGGNTNAKLNLEIHGVILDGLSIYPKINNTTTVAPLLIHSIGSYTNLNMSGVETSNYDSTSGCAASSLIGAVGSDTGGHMQLTFSDMVLDGSPENTIFSRALFLEEFRYAGDSSGVYNFTNTEDKRYTLGQELSNTADRTEENPGPSGRNNGLQYCFFEDTTEVCKVAGGETADPANYFNSYKRYVYHTEDGDYHELDINLSREGLTEGCGTYRDPYIIRTAAQLKDLAMALNSAVEGLKIQVDTGVLNGNTLNSFSKCHVSGVYDTHKIYTCDTSGWFDGSINISENVKLYLRNAYYKIITPDIELPGDWTGLGADSNSAFCGVIDGNDNTITIGSLSGTPSQFGGLIKFSMGSVVKDLTVHYDNVPTVNCQGIPTNTSDASFFGGVVGWCLGGDTILDNVSVTGLSTPSVTGTNPHLAAVGGYVGMVGGAMIESYLKYGGGVVFRGPVGSGLSGGNAAADNNYFYVNPYVGRVLDGYALTETEDLENTNKNYRIPCISDGTYLTRDDSNKILVSGAEGLWLLSAIANSGAGAMQVSNCLAYTTGKARTAAYGDMMDAAASADEGFIGGRENKTKDQSYLTRFVSGDFHNICSSGVSIELNSSVSGFDMSDYGNGFRGIGTSYGTNANNNCNYRLLQVTSVVGNGNTVTLNQCRKEYVEEKDNWTAIGAGMFVLMGVPNNGTLTVSDLTFTGKTGIQYFKETTQAVIGNLNYGKKKTTTNTGDRLTLAGAGMLTGSFAKFGTITKVTCENVTVAGSEESHASINKDSLGTTFAGGLIGALWNNGTVDEVIFSGCSARHVDVNGRLDTGGLIGYLKATTASIDGQGILSDVSIATSQVEAKALTGAAGLLGLCEDCTLTIGEINKTLSVCDIRVTSSQSGSSNDYFSFGGLVGAWMMINRNDANSGSITNVSMQGEISVCGGINGSSNSTSGGVIGNLYDSKDNWNTSAKKTHLEVNNVRIATGPGSCLKIYNSKQIGGIIGMIKAQRNTTKWPETVKLTDIQIGSTSSNVTLTANTYKQNNAEPQVGGIVGVITIDPIVELTNVRIVNSNVLTSGSDGAAGVIVGYADGHTNNATEIRMHDVYAENCKAVVDSDNANAGLLVGNLRNNSHKVMGDNILLKDCAVGVSLKNDTDSIKSLKSTNEVPTLERIGLKGNSAYKSYGDIGTNIQSYNGNNNIGSLVGGLKTDTKTIQLVGVSIQQTEGNQLPVRDFGTNKAITSDSYVIRADYQGTCMGEEPNTTGASSPYVTINPLSPLKIPEMNLTGDGAAFSESTTPMLSRILEEDKYYNCSDSRNYLQKMSQGENSVVTLTHFKDQELNTSVEMGFDFPVIVLQTNSSDEANRCLSSVISMLTNWELCTATASGDSVTVNQGSFYALNAVSYKWNDGAFAEQDNQSLYVEDNRFYLKPGGYDNRIQQFTLVDVAYKNPSKTDSTVYHLYIPVVVKKMFEYKFWASAKIGTTYSIDPYESLSQAVIASHGENVTAVLNYEYQWSEDEWADAMENGQNLLWNFDLGVEFDPYALPAGTRLTLIDRNNQDQVYYASAGSAVKTISFKEFKNGKVAWDADRYLCDDLKLTATQSGTGKFYRIGKTKTNDATLRDVDGNYYRTATQEDEVSSRYDLTITGLEASGKVTAQFYLSLYTSADTSGIVNSNIQCSDNLSGNLPTRRLSACNEERQYAKRGSENKIVLGDFFTQTQSVTTTRGEEKMTETNAEIPLELTTQISFNTAIANAETLYREYAAGQRLYQKFELKLKKYPGSIQTDLVRGTQIEVQCYLGDEAIGDPVNEVLPGAVSSYPLELCWTDGELGIPAEEVRNGMVLKAKVRLIYLPAARIEQFPVRSNETSNDGIAVAASSSLAYSLDFLRSNSNHGIDIEAKCGDMIPHFYREDTGAASLYYVAYENQNGSPAESVSELGINGRDGSSFTIHSAALYNVSEVRGAEAADTLKVTISLLEKQDGSTYDNLNYKAVNGSLSNYLSSLQVNAHFKKGGAIQAFGDPQDALTAADNTLYFDLRGYDPDVQIQIPITLTVLTGEGFAGTYANYRIRVSAQLMDGENQITNSAASDYIVYTNAKICQTFIDINS